MNFRLVEVKKDELTEYKKAMQEAFQLGFQAYFGKTDRTVLPEKDIDDSIYKKGAITYKALLNDEFVGGVVVVIEESQNNHLDILFVKSGIQGKGIGKAIWQKIETMFPKTITWSTCTPYFDRRNIHFYVNVCGFHITEFYNEKHPMKEVDSEFIGDGNLGMFEFVKKMK